MGDLRVPIASSAAHQELLGSAIASDHRAGEFLAGLTEDDFPEVADRRVFRACLACIEVDTVWSWRQVQEHLTEKGDMPGRVPVDYLQTLGLMVTGDAHGMSARRRVIADRSRRRMIETAREVMEQASTACTQQSIEDAAARLRVGALEALEIDTTSGVGPVSSVEFDAVVDDFESPVPFRGVPMGLRDLDQVTGGLHNGLSVVAARPAVGKTLLGCQVVNAWAADEDRNSRGREGRRRAVLWVSLEVGRRELASRMLLEFSGVAAPGVGEAVAPEDVRRLRRASRILGTRAVELATPEGGADLGLHAIESMAHRLAHGNGLRGVVVDHLGLVEVGGRRMDSREREVAMVSRRLNNLGTSLGVPVLACVQLNRGLESRERKEPRLHDLRESGAIEQDSHAVVLLSLVRDVGTGEIINPPRLRLDVAKNRHGSTGVVELPICYRRGRVGGLRGDEPIVEEIPFGGTVERAPMEFSDVEDTPF